MVGVMFQSCETTELEILDNPNALTEGDPTFLLNSIQANYRAAQVTFNDRSSELTRIDYMFGRNYFANYNSATMNGPWGNLYSGMLPDILAIEAAQNENNDLRMHLAISKTLQAHIMMQLADFIGDIVPLEETGDPIGNPTPQLTNDAGATAYNQALMLLDEALALFNQNPSAIGVQDLFFGDLSTGGEGEQDDTSIGKWINVVNTLKMRAAITVGDYTTFDAIVATDNYIMTTDNDLQFSYGGLLTPADTRHQDYQADYTTSGANIYQSNWLMELMRSSNDPRIRYYFYRQNACTPGASCNTAGDGESLQCSLQAIPTHLQGTPCGDIWCFMEDGYWGRPPGDDNGTPPDGDTRTAVGVYPAAGRFDDDSFESITLGQGGGGLGIEPIILASYVDFWKAEAALAQGQTGPAAMHLENGLIKSIAKVQTFGVLDETSDLDTFEPTAAQVSNYISSVVASFSAATGDAQWNILAEQYFITMFGGGADAHNFYRRTGYPNTVCPNIDPNPGNYPRTFLYPQSEVVANPNIVQRNNNDDAVFWNTQPLPSSN